MDGKTGETGSPLDGNSTTEMRWINGDSHFRFGPGGTEVTVSPTLSIDTWYRVLLKWRTDAGGGNTVELTVGDETDTTTVVPDFSGFDVDEYHSILWGNDLSGTSCDYHLDALRTWNYWNDSI